MSATAISLIAFACIFGGTFLGMLLRRRLPAHPLTGDTKEVVQLGIGLIATIAALVLGLLIAAAHSSYDNQSGQVRQLTANIILLDRTLALYGAEADSARILLRRSVNTLADRLWRPGSSDSSKAEPFEASNVSLALYEEILILSPRNEAQRSLQARALDAITDVGKARLLLFANGKPIPMPFLVVLVSWLTIIFVTFSLFADSNAATITALGVFAFSAAAAIFLILELGQPFAGLMMISDEPLRSVLEPLAR